MHPVYGPDGTGLVDFAVEYLNPAAQRTTGLPERPNVTARARFPDIFTNGVFDFYRRVFETGEPGRYNFNYQADGFDSYFHVAARRSGNLLLVSFTDTADHQRNAVEVALRQRLLALFRRSAGPHRHPHGAQLRGGTGQQSVSAGVGKPPAARPALPRGGPGAGRTGLF